MTSRDHASTTNDGKQLWLPTEPWRRSCVTRFLFVLVLILWMWRCEPYRGVFLDFLFETSGECFSRLSWFDSSSVHYYVVGRGNHFRPQLIQPSWRRVAVVVFITILSCTSCETLSEVFSQFFDSIVARTHRASVSSLSLICVRVASGHFLSVSLRCASFCSPCHIVFLSRARLWD